MKKLISLVLALALVLASCAVAFAADPAYKITVTNANKNISIEGKEFQAYKIFDATQQTIDGTKYVSYFIKNDNYYYTTAAAKTELEKYFTFEANTADPTLINVKVKNTSGVLSSADAYALSSALTGMLPSSPNATATGSGTPATAVLDVTSSGAGYYLVTGEVKSSDPTNTKTTPTAVALVNVLDDQATIKAKADLPPLEKVISAVEEGSILDTAGKEAEAQVGKKLSHELHSVVPDLTGYDDYRYAFFDTMGNGLTYNQDAKVYIGEGTNEEVLDATKYTVEATDASHFVISIPYETMKELQPKVGQKVTVKYTVTINADAVQYDWVNNTAYLEYSSTPGGTPYDHTPEDETYEIDINVDVNKYTKKEDGTNQALANAEFMLFKGAKTVDQTGNIFYKWDETNGAVTWVAKASGDVIKTNAAGNLEKQFKGLAAGTYCLLETKAPDGFNALSEPVEFTLTVTVDTNNNKKLTITSTEGTVSGGNEDGGKIDLSKSHGVQPVATIDVLNNHGTQLPSTGGIGTTIFYILGGLLVIGAAVILVARRKAQD